jgi:hypothetical protein
LWDYGYDALVVVSGWSWIPLAVTVFLVDRRNVDEHHQIICLTPTSRWCGFWDFITGRTRLASSVLEGSRLRLFNPVVGGVAAFDVHRQGELYRTLSRVGNYAAATVPMRVFERVMAQHRVTRGVFAEHAIVKHTGKVDDGTSTLLMDLVAECDYPVDYRVFPVDLGMVNYQFVRSEADIVVDAAPRMTCFMLPIVAGGGFAPLKTEGNDDRAVASRVEKFQGRRLPNPTPFLHAVMREFAELLFPEPHILAPWSIEDVGERQVSARQRRDFALFSEQLPTQVTKTFIKPEAYDTEKDPRIISQINPVDKIEYLAFMYPLSEFMKKFSWYAFGKTPADVAARVAALARLSCHHLSFTDFTRMDGTISQVIRLLERIVVMRAFVRESHNELDRLMQTQSDLRGVTQFGLWYQTLWARLSGSAETSPFNTLVNVFTTYLAWRMTKVSGDYVCAEDAYDQLGLAGGDDGVTPDLPAASFERACGALGLIGTLEVVPKGELGVKFLAREYGPDVWAGDPNSRCDLMRQLTKFHMTAKLPDGITPMMKLREKAESFLATDANTAIIGPLVRRVMEVTTANPEHVKEIMARWNPFGDGNNYPNEGCFVESVPEWADPREFLAALSGATGDDLLRLPPVCIVDGHAGCKAELIATGDGQAVVVNELPQLKGVGKKAGDKGSDLRGANKSGWRAKPVQPKALGEAPSRGRGRGLSRGRGRGRGTPQRGRGKARGSG